jgi:hypothetical protein
MFERITTFFKVFIKSVFQPKIIPAEPLRIRIPPERLTQCKSCDDVYSIAHYEECPTC